MAECIVDVFELVEVEEHDGGTTLITFSGYQGLAEPVEQKNPVWQAGQEIVLDHVTGMVFKEIILADVKQYSDIADDFFIHVPNDFDCQIRRFDPLFTVFFESCHFFMICTNDHVTELAVAG